MALRAYEVMLIARAQNQASGALRSVARDIAGLGKAASFASQKQALMGRNADLLRRQAIATRALSDVSGKQLAIDGRRLALDRKQVATQDAITRGFTARRSMLVQEGELVRKRIDLAHRLDKAEEKLRKMRGARAAFTGGMAGLSGQAMTDAQSMLPLYSRKIKDAQHAVEDLTAKQATNAAQFPLLNQRYRDNSNAIRGNVKALRDMPTEYAKLGAAQTALATKGMQAKNMLAKIDQQIAENATRMRELNKAVSAQRWDRVTRAGNAIRDVGRTARLFGLVTVAAFGAAAHEAAQFSEEVSLAATQTGRIGSGADTVRKNAKKIGDGILAQMKRFPADQHKMAQAAYEIFSSTNLGVESVGEGMKLLALFNKASVAGMVDLHDATNAGVTVMNDFKKSTHDMPQVLQTMFAAVRFGRMTFSEFTQSLNQVGPAFAGAGQSFETMAGSMAFLTRLMPSTRMASTSLARLTEMFARPDFVKGVKKFGVNILDTHKRLLPMPDIIDKLTRRFPKLKEGGQFLQNFFKTMTAAGSGGLGTAGTIQGRRALQFMALFPGLFRQIINQVKTDNNEFGRSLAAQQNTQGQQWKRFVNRIRSDIISIGQDVIPALTKIFAPIQRLIDWFEGLDRATRRNAVQFAVWAGGIAIVGGALSALGGGLLGLLGIFGKFGFFGKLVGLAIAAIAADSLKGGSAVHYLTDALKELMSLLGRGVSSFLDMSGRSWQGFAIGATVASIGALKLARAVRTARAAGGAGGVERAGGLIPFMLGSPGKIRQSTSAISRAFRTGTVLGKGKFLAGAADEVMKVERSAGRMRGAIAAAGQAAVMLPGPLKLAAAAVGVLGGAAYLWHRHMEGVRQKIERIKAQQSVFYTLISAPARAAVNFGTLSHRIGDLVAQQADLKILNAQIEIAQRGLKTQKAGPERRIAEAQLSQLFAERVTIQERIANATTRVNRRFDDMGRIIRGTASALQLAHGQHQKLLAAEAKHPILIRRAAQAEAKMQDLRKSLGAGRGPAGDAMIRNAVLAWQALNEQVKHNESGIRNLKASYAITESAIRGTVGRTRRAFVNLTRDLHSMNLMPKIDAGQVSRMLSFISKKGRMLTLPEMKAIINAEINPASIRKLPGQLKRIVGQYKTSVAVDAKIKIHQDAIKRAAVAAQKGRGANFEFNALVKLKQSQIKLPKPKSIVILTKVQSPLPQAAKLHAGVAKIFKPTIPQPIKIQDNASGPAGVLKSSLAALFGSSITQTININTVRTYTSLGSPTGGGGGKGAESSDAIARGTAAGMTDMPKLVVDQFKATTNAVQDYLQASSPSRLYAVKVGKPIMEGILLGMARKRGDLVKEATLQLELFQGPWLQAKADKDFEAVNYALFQTKALQDKMSNLEDKAKYRKKVFSLQSRIAAIMGKKKEGPADAMRLGQYRKELNALQRSGKALSALDLTRDMQKTAAQTNLFVTSLEQLQKRKIPTALLKQLQELGVDGAQQIALLANASDQKLAVFVAAWRKAERAVGRFNQAQKDTLKITRGDVIKDMQAQIKQMRQFNNDMAKLAKRGVPRELLEMLAQTGEEGLRFLHMMATAGPKEFNTMLRTLKQWGSQNKRTMQESMQAQKDAVKAGKADTIRALHDMYVQMLDEMKGFAGALFEGLDAIVSAGQERLSAFTSTFPSVFAGFDEYMAAQQQAAQDAAQAADDAIRQQEDIARQIKEAHDHLQDQMGALFSGPWLTGDDVRTRLDWGEVLGIEDLKRDLREQVDRFKRWRSDLNRLLGRGLPQDLVKQLEELGPEALDNLDVLVNASDADLKEYVAIWKDGQNAIGDVAVNIQVELTRTIGTLVPTIRDLTAVLKQNMESWTNWASDLDLLIKRGLPSDLIQQLVDAGPQAAAAVHLLATATDSELQNFINIWNQGVGAMKKFGEDFTAAVTPEDIIKNLEKQVGDFETWQNTIAELAKKVPPSVLKELEALGPGAEPYLIGLNTMSEGQLAQWVALWKQKQADITTATKDEMQLQVGMWRKHGQDIAIALTQGVQDEQDALIAYFTSLFNWMIQNGSPGPPRGGSSGGLTDRGTDTGGVPGGSKGQIVRGSTDSFMDSTPGGGSTTIVYQNITAVQDETLDTTLSRARFRMENRR